jgi:hypothetical protein
MAPSSRRARANPSLLALASIIAMASPTAARAGEDVPEKPPVVAGPTPIADETKRAAILKIIDEMREEASRVRGLPWKTPVPADVISREQLRIDFARMAKEETKPDVYDRSVRLARRLGLLGEKEDPIEIELRFLEKGVAGYYNPKTKRFYVIDGLSGDAQRPTILHELTHALDDQYFDLDKLTDPLEEDSDRLFAMKCVEEGAAEFARHRYESSHQDIASLAVREQMKGSDGDAMSAAIKTAPAFLIVPTLLNYRTGPLFITRAVGSGSFHDTMEMLYADPPVSQEQVLHPARYLGRFRDLPQRIAWPDGLAAALGEGWRGDKPVPAGELDLALWFERWLGGNDGHLSTALLGKGRAWGKASDVAARGWDGVTMQLLQKDGGGSALAVILAWDSKEDAAEAGDAILKCLAARDGKLVEGASWKDGADGARVFDYTGSFGPGRIVVRGDVVRWLDGAPSEALERAFTPLAAAVVERDAADTWSREKEGEPFARAAWRSDDGQVAWEAPSDGWTLERDGAAAIARFGDVELRLSSHSATGIPLLVGNAVQSLRAKDSGLKPMVDQLEERAIAWQDGVRLPVVTSSKRANARNYMLVIVPAGDVTFIGVASAPTAVWKDRQAAIEAAIDGLRFAD